jgi:hypothetical protein
VPLGIPGEDAAALPDAIIQALTPVFRTSPSNVTLRTHDGAYYLLARLSQCRAARWLSSPGSDGDEAALLRLFQLQGEEAILTADGRDDPEALQRLHAAVSTAPDIRIFLSDLSQSVRLLYTVLASLAAKGAVLEV